ncbi:DapH/DapD/GlmU-related protein, partial [Clostridium perfringens]
IAPGVTLSGGVKVGRNSHIGTNSTVIQGISIGEDSIVGAGTVIIRDVGDNIKVCGNPGREIL